MIDKELERVEQVLHAAGYETFNVKIPGKRNKLCYDILVQHRTSRLVFLVKLFTNIDNINMNMVNDIKAMSLLLNSKPLLIGLKNRYQNLEDNTIYLREGLPFISLKTLEKIMIKQQYPHILARRGGGVIFIDGKEMKHAREQKSVTRKELSEKLNVTKRTVCAYENESMAPSVEMAEKIRELLEKDNLYRSINVLDWRIKFDLDEKSSEKEQELTNFETHLQEIIEDIGISSYWYKKGQAPVELALFSKSWYMTQEDDFYPLLSGVSEDRKKFNEFFLNNLKIFTELFQKHVLFIVNNEFKIPEKLEARHIPFIKIKKLEEVDDEVEFVELVQKEQK